jgi:hypothetical protein
VKKYGAARLWASADGGAGPTVNGRKDSTEGRDCTEGRVCVGRKGFGWLTEQEDLGRMEGFRVVDGMEGSGLEERVRLVGWKGLRL